MRIETEIYNHVIILKVDRTFEYNELNFLSSIQTIHPKLRIAQWSFDKLIMLVPNITREQLQAGLSTLRRKIEKRFKSQVFIGVGNCEEFYSLSVSYSKANIALTVAIADETEIVFEEDSSIDLL